MTGIIWLCPGCAVKAAVRLLYMVSSMAVLCLQQRRLQAFPPLLQHPQGRIVVLPVSSIPDRGLRLLPAD